MEIACSDLIKQRILQEIKKKEETLKESYINVKKQAVENKFFQSVLDDYERYYKYIKTDKEKQIEVLQKIADHLDRLGIKTTTLNNKARTLKDDQKIVLEKLGNLRDELQELTK